MSDGVTLTTAPAVPEPAAELQAPTPRAEECATFTPSAARLPVSSPQATTGEVSAQPGGSGLSRADLSHPHAFTGPARLVLRERVARDAELRSIWRRYQALAASGMSQTQSAAALGISPAKLTRLKQRVAAVGSAGLARAYGSGRPCDYVPTDAEIACVREIYASLDAGEIRGPNTGSSKIAAYRMAARSNDPRVSELFRGYVLRRQTKRLPNSWMRLLDQTESVMRVIRQPSRLHVYISTPRKPTWVNAEGAEVPLRAGDLFESDDGTVNFYCWVPWPFGGDKCSDKYGVRLGRYQLLPVVDVRSRFITAFHFIARGKSSYRGEDVMALFGDTFRGPGKPQVLRLERGSWESQIVRDALELARVPVVNAWHAKQKNAVENCFDRLWTPMSRIKGHAGRDRGQIEQTTDLAIQCQEGRRDPREFFPAMQAAMSEIVAAVEYTNTEPVNSRDWGTWVPQEVYVRQTTERPLPTLDPELSIFFAREQRRWTVRGGLVGNSVEGPLLKVPIYFQTAELWEFEGILTRCYFDPYASEIRGTIVLDEDWKGLQRGHLIARDVPAMDLPPTAVLRQDYGSEAEAQKTLAVRKAMTEAVRTEAWTWLGQRSSTARDGMGNVAQADRSLCDGAHVVTGEPSHGREAHPRLVPDPIAGPHETRANTPRPAASQLEPPTLSRGRAPVFRSAYEEALM